MNQEPTNREILNAVQSTRGELLEAVSANSGAILELSHRQDLSERKTDEILVAINDFASHVEERFQKVEGKIDKIESTMATKDDLAKLKTQMVNKDYLDDKLADQRGDLIKFFRREIATSRG